MLKGKWHLRAIAAGSVNNVHIFTMYEGSNAHSKMTLVLPKF